MATTAAKAPAPRTSEMQQFTWEGTDKRGVKMKGETTSKNANLLRAELRKQGINPTVVRTKSKPLFGSAGKAISAQDISVFSRQIATMLQAGVPMVQSFEILAGGQKNPRMRDMLIDIAYLRLPASTVDTAKKVLKVIKIQDLHVDGLGTSGFPVTNFGDDLVRSPTETICAELCYFATNLLGATFNFSRIGSANGCLSNGVTQSLWVTSN